jgi:hypothetical protein
MRTASGMQQIVPSNRLRRRIGEERISETHPAGVTLVDLGRVNADRDDADPTLFEFGKPFLETPQLGVTEWSPMPAIKNHDRGMTRRGQIGEGNQFSILIRQTEVGSALPDFGRTGRGWQLVAKIKDSIGKQPDTGQCQECENRPKNFAAMRCWITKCPDQTAAQKNRPDRKEEEIYPRKITSDRELDEKGKGEKTGQDTKKSYPERPVPAFLHTRFATQHLASAIE